MLKRLLTCGCLSVTLSVLAAVPAVKRADPRWRPGGDSATGYPGSSAAAAMSLVHNQVLVPPQGSTNAQVQAWLDAFAARGQLYQIFMNDASDLVQQSPYSSYQDLNRYGWVPTTGSLNGVISADGIYPVPLLVEQLQVSTSAHDNFLITSKLRDDYHPTGLQYTNIYNPSEGVVYALNSVSPQEPISIDSSTQPPMRTWSDITFLELREHFGGANRVEKLDRIIQIRCNDEVTLGLVNTILGSTPWFARMPPSVEDPQNMQRYYRCYEGSPQERRNGRALLASPAGTRVAMLLSQHQDPASGIGMKRVKGIKILRDDAVMHNHNFPNYHGPTLIFELENVPTPPGQRTGGMSTAVEGKGKGKEKDDDRGQGSGKKNSNLFGGSMTGNSKVAASG